MIETIYLDRYLSGTALNANNALGNTPNTWAGQGNTNTSWTSVWGFPMPSNPRMGGLQRVTVTARKGSNSNSPSVRLNVYRLGVLVAALPLTKVTSTTGQALAVEWTDTGFSEEHTLEVINEAVGGSATARNSAQISMAVWEAETVPPLFALPIRIWDGSGWVEPPAKTWQAGAWRTARVRAYQNGKWT